MMGAASLEPVEAPPDACLQQLAQAIPVGVLLCRDGRVLWANEPMAVMAGGAAASTRWRTAISTR